jgi:hypothetical protein
MKSYCGEEATVTELAIPAAAWPILSTYCFEGTDGARAAVAELLGGWTLPSCRTVTGRVNMRDPTPKLPVFPSKLLTTGGD